MILCVDMSFSLVIIMREDAKCEMDEDMMLAFLQVYQLFYSRHGV